MCVRDVNFPSICKTIDSASGSQVYFLVDFEAETKVALLAFIGIISVVLIAMYVLTI